MHASIYHYHECITHFTTRILRGEGSISVLISEHVIGARLVVLLNTTACL